MFHPKPEPQEQINLPPSFASLDSLEGLFADPGVKRFLFSSIASTARQVCQLSDHATLTGGLTTEEFIYLQTLTQNVMHHLVVLDRITASSPPSLSASPTFSTPSTATSSPSSSPSPSPTSSDDSIPTRKRVRKTNASSDLLPTTTISTITSTSTPSVLSSSTATGTQATSGAKRRKKDDPDAKNKKCSDCGRMETNQWRTGPSGGSTLCNACGMRYSRRLKRQMNPPTLNRTNHRHLQQQQQQQPLNNFQSQCDLYRSGSPTCGLDQSPISSPLPTSLSPSLPSSSSSSPSSSLFSSFARCLPREPVHLPSSPSLDDLAAASTSPSMFHREAEEKRSTVYTLLN